MMAGHQAKGLSFWTHGSMVAARFRDLMNPNPCMTWRLPDWFTSNQNFIRASLMPDFKSITEYHQWHDLGKPYCQIIDDEGRTHYPNHAEVSADIWRSLGGDSKIGQLIADDMLCHQLRPAEALAFASNPNALTLLVTALCELHANAAMFGGIESDSFKIKYKRLDKCGAIILNQLFPKE